MSEIDLFFLSFDEPNAEENWANLLEKAPWAKRVHGVKGFDAAHKECARQSETSKFITIDGDNILDEKFLELELDIPKKYEDCTISWNSKNIINGLVYGNGGVKLWDRNFVNNMKYHESSEDEHMVDFCWDPKYIQLWSIWSETHPNASAYQAFRAGFREGCKMSLDRGKKFEDITKIKDGVYALNLKRLIIWCCIGSDVEYGMWANYGAALGLYKTNIEKDFDLAKISDYDWFKEFANDEIYRICGEYPRNSITANAHIAEKLANLFYDINKTMGLDLCYFGHQQSKFFKLLQEYKPLQQAMNAEAEILYGLDLNEK